MGFHKGEDMKRILCVDCNRYCKNEKCMRFHKGDGICERFFRCKACGKLERSEFRFHHKCGIMRCKNCGEIVNALEHKCHMKMLASKGGRCIHKLCTCKGGERKVEKVCEYETCIGSDLNKLIGTIKKNFRRLALQLHPDKNLPTSDRYKFGQLVDAYNNLREGLGIDNNDFNLERNGEWLIDTSKI